MAMSNDVAATFDPNEAKSSPNRYSRSGSRAKKAVQNKIARIGCDAKNPIK